MYKDFGTVVCEKKYNLVSVDGPLGGENISRIDIIPFVPDILAKDFVVLIDDANRKGEKKMINCLKERLDGANIEFAQGMLVGETHVEIITSKSLSFLTTI